MHYHLKQEGGAYPKTGLGSSYLTFKTFQGPAHAHLCMNS